jgi:hypothetical protein
MLAHENLMAEEAPLLSRLGRPGDVVSLDVSLVDCWEASERPTRLFVSCEILFNVKPAVFGRVQIDVEAIHGSNAVRLENQTRNPTKAIVN